jgi:hypothetical protein
MMSTRLAQLTTVAALAVTGAVIGTQFVSGAGESSESIFVSVTPCRLVDTRPGDINVGPRDTKIGPDETATFTAWGTGDADSPCDLPDSATAIATNTVAIAPTARSFMTLYPGDVDNPGTANLNYTAGQAPTPNAANVPLSPTGTFNVFNAFGDVHVVIDINGYYQPATSDAPAGDPGPKGDPGQPGAPGAQGPPGDAPDPNRMPLDDILEGRWDRDPGRFRTYDVTGVQSEAVWSDGSDLLIGFDGGIERLAIDTGATLATGSASPAQGRARDITVFGDDVYVTAFHPSNAFSSPGSIQRFDLATLAPIGAPIAAPTGAEYAAVANGRLYVGGSVDSFVTVVDLATGQQVDADPSTPGVVDDIGLAAPTRGIAAVGTDVFVAINSAADQMVEIDADLDVQTLTGIAEDFHHLASDGTLLYGWDIDDQVMRTMDPTTGLEVGSSFAIGASVDVGPIEYDGRWLYVGNPTEAEIIIVDPATRSKVGSIPDISPRSMHFDGASLWSAGYVVARHLPL